MKADISGEPRQSADAQCVLGPAECGVNPTDAGAVRSGVVLPTETAFDHVADLEVGIASFNHFADGRAGNCRAKRHGRHRPTEGRCINEQAKHRVHGHEVHSDKEFAFLRRGRCVFLDSEVQRLQLILGILAQHDALPAASSGCHKLPRIFGRRAFGPTAPAVRDYTLPWRDRR